MHLTDLLRPVLFSPVARQIWGVVLTLLTVVVLYMTLSPATTAQPSTGWDKLDHVLAFASLAFCAHHALHGHLSLQLRVWTGLLLLGTGIEFAQTYVPGRDGDWVDVVADAAGIAVGLWSGSALARGVERRVRARVDVA